MSIEQSTCQEAVSVEVARAGYGEDTEYLYEDRPCGEPAVTYSFVSVAPHTHGGEMYLCVDHALRLGITEDEWTPADADLTFPAT